MKNVLIKKLIQFIAILIISFEMCFATTIINLSQYRTPAASQNESQIDAFISAMQAFKEDIVGKDDCNHDSDQQPLKVEDNRDEVVLSDEEDLDYGDIVRKVQVAKMSIINEKQRAFSQNLKEEKENACILKNKKMLAPQKEKCEIKDGLIYEIGQKVGSLSELEDQINFKLWPRDPLVKQFLMLKKEAIESHQIVKRIVFDDSIQPDQRRNVLLAYISSVLWPMRELVVVLTNIIQNKKLISDVYEALLPTFPTDLFPVEDTELRNMLSLGPQAAVEPFYLNIIDQDNNQSAIEFDSVKAVERDILVLMRAPTVNNYIIASKWLTTQMLLSQYTLYTSMINDQKEINENVKNACFNRENGDFAHYNRYENLGNEENNKTGDELMDEILQNHGLVLSDIYFNYFFENLDKDPMVRGYSGLAPFEAYKFAQIGINRPNLPEPLRPSIDDISGYDDVITLRLHKALALFDQEFIDSKTKQRKRFEYRGKEYLNKILYLPSSEETYGFLDADQKVVEINAIKNNLSIYLVERMQRLKKTKVEEIIPGNIKQMLSKNVVKIKFPSLYSSSVWRDSAVIKLYKVLLENQNNKKAKDKIVPFMTKACSESAYQNPEKVDLISRDICLGFKIERNQINAKQGFEIADSTSAYKAYDHFLEHMTTLLRKDLFVPGTRIEEEQFEHVWIAFASLWDDLRDQTDLLDFANMNEYDYIMEQMLVDNPWVRSRLSYVLLRNELSSELKGVQQYSNFAGRNCQDSAKCYQINQQMKLKLLKKAGKILALDQIQGPHFANRILSRHEKKFYWNDVIQNTNDSNFQLFGVKTQAQTPQVPFLKENTDNELLMVKLFKWGKSVATNMLTNKADTQDENYYNLIEQISYKNLFTKDQTDDFLDQTFDTSIEASRQSELESIWDSDMGRYSGVLYSLYRNKGNPMEQERLYFEFLQNNKDMEQLNPKEAFFIMDGAIKLPIYKELLVRSAKVRRNQIEETLVDFCETKLDEHQKLQTIFYATMKSQNKLNQIIGIPGFNAKVMDEMLSMSAEEWTDVKYSFGMMGLIMGSVMFGSLCTSLSVGACGPLAYAMVASAVSGYGIQYGLYEREKNRYQKSKDYAKVVESMEDLGMTDNGSSKKVEKSSFWTVLEASGLLAFLGPTARSMYLGSRFTQIIKNSKNLSRARFNALTKQAMREADTRFALDVLEFKTIGQKMGLDENQMEVSKNFEKLKETFGRFKDGKMTHNQLLENSADLLKSVTKIPSRVIKGLKQEFFGEIVVMKNQKELDKQASQVIARYWNYDPQALLAHLKSYEQGSILRKGLAGIDEHIKANKLGTGYLKWRFGNLLSNGEDILKLEKMMEQVIYRNGDFQLFLENNMDLIAKVFAKLPVRKREFIHMALLQGGPNLRGNILGRRIPYLYEMADGLMMRKFVNARNRLLLEDLSRQSREILGQSSHIASEIAQTSVHDFTVAINELKTRKLKNIASRKVEFLFESLKDDVTKMALAAFKSPKYKNKMKNIIKNYSRVTQLSLHQGKFTGAELKRLLFEFEDLTIEEQNFASSLWEIMPVNDVFKLNQFEKLSHEVVSEFSNYEGVDDFTKYLNALKIQLFNKNDLLLDYM